MFFLVCGLVNIYIAFWLPQSVWVNFKVFGLTGVTLLFTLICGVYIYRHLPGDQENQKKKKASSHNSLKQYTVFDKDTIPVSKNALTDGYTQLNQLD